MTSPESFTMIPCFSANIFFRSFLHFNAVLHCFRLNTGIEDICTVDTQEVEGLSLQTFPNLDGVNRFLLSTLHSSISACHLYFN